MRRFEKKKCYTTWLIVFISSWCQAKDKLCDIALNPYLTCCSQWLWGQMACGSFCLGHWLFAQIWVSGPSPSASSQASANAKQLGSLAVVAGDSPGQWHLSPAGKEEIFITVGKIKASITRCSMIFFYLNWHRTEKQIYILTTSNTYILIGHVPVRPLTIGHHLPQDNAIAPNIAGGGELAILDSFWGCPTDGDFAALESSQRATRMLVK